MSVSLRIVLVFSILFLNTHPAHSKGENQDKSKAKAKGTVRTNRLAKETSPYLLAHAHNPVDWYPWGPEALEKAKSEDKPIFLSVGYSSCHWCHVMEKKVFSDEEIAAYMNEHFVNIKVDREERPDIDDIYMTSLQVYYSLIGNPQSGGWPLSMFLTPEGKPLGGATYLPPKTDDGSTSFPELMENVVANWTDAERRKKFESNADILTRAVQESFRRAPVLSPVSIDEKLVSKTLAALQQSFDSEKGGFGFSIRAPNRPKFPTPPKLEFLLSVAQNPTHEKSARRMLALTLDRMGAGGIYDHIGGGFHRYSTDRSWRIPHFEKMLYDNAQLAAVYTAAFELTKNRRYQTIAEETIGFVLRELTDPKGGFYSALDADSEGVEGKYYAWTTEQLQEILNADELAICQQVYGAAGRPNFEEGHVLQFVDSLEESAEALKLDTEELEQRLDPIRKKLLRERLRRKAPPRDDKILCGWNGLMIAALADAAVVFNRPEYLRAARTAAEFILKDMRQENGRLFRTYCVGEARIDAYLEDYAMLIHGLLALERATRDERYANAARRLTDLQLTLFWDDKAAGCFATSTSHEKLLVRTKPAYDSVTPSGNTVTVRNLLEIAAISGEAGYRKKADAALAEFAPTLDESPTSMANLATAIAESLTTNRKPNASSNRNRDAEPTDDQDNDRSGRDQSRRGNRSNANGRVVQVADNGESKPQPAAKKKKVLDRINAKVFFAADPLPPGKSTKVLVQITVDEGWHIHSNPPGDPDVDIATEITADSELGLELKSVKFPPGRIVPREEGPDARYLDGKVAVFGVLTVPAEAAGNEEELVVEIRYQACNDSQCLQPRTLKVPVTVAVAKRVNDSRPANEKLFNSAPSSERGAGKARRGE